MTPFGYSGVLHVMVTSMVYILVLSLYSLSLVENTAFRPNTTLGAAEGRSEKSVYTVGLIRTPMGQKKMICSSIHARAFCLGNQ